MMLQLAEQLRERSHEVVPIGPENGDPWLAGQFRASGFEPRAYSLRRAADPSCLAQVVGLLRRERIDVVHSHDFFAAVYGGAAAWMLRKPHVITMHGTRYYLGRRHRRAALRWSAKHSRAVVGVSAATAAELTSSLKLAPSAVRVIYNGVPKQEGQGDRVRSELGLAPNELFILSVGSLFPVKGHPVLLEALASIGSAEGTPRWRAAIAGIGDQEDTLRASILRHDLADRVQLLGFRSDVADLLAAADVFVLPSLSEGSPLALMEAMFAGKAIVASRTGGIPELVRHGGEALLPSPGDASDLATALRAVLVDGELRARLGTAAQRAASSFTLERMTDEYERIYAGD
jgi:glycosyltransferase involved in cell wall biosynthesis